MFDVRVSNIKISLKTNLDISRNQFPNEKRINNFLVYRQDSFVYVIFPKGHVNVTGIKSYNDISRAVDVIKETVVNFSPSFKITKLNIDNISAHGRITNEIINLWTFIDKARDKTIIIGIEFDPCTFPALKIYTTLGTALLFSNGKINLSGCKRLKHVQSLYGICKQFLSIGHI